MSGLCRVIAHRSANNLSGLPAASLPLKMDGGPEGYLPPLSEYFARIIVDALNAKAGNSAVHYSLEPVE